MTPLACILAAALSAAPGLSAAARADIDAIPGAYMVQTEGRTCSLRLEPPSRAPEDSLVEAEKVSGLVLAAPTCPEALDTVFFWQAPADGARLTLIDAAGQAVFEGEPDGARGFAGRAQSGADLVITRR